MKRNKFSLSNTRLLSCDMGELVPIGLLEVLPGDSIQQATTCLIRCAPMLAPVMHNVNVQLSHWFVPHRLVWPAFEDFITGGPDGNDATAFPTRGGFTASVGSLADYLGVPTGTPITISALPFRGYALIWNEYFRDQDLQTELVIEKGSGNDATTSTALQRAAWDKDYLTSCRPWEQKGPTITLPLGTQASVRTTIGTGGHISINAGAAGTPDDFRQQTADTATVKLSATAGTSPGMFADLTGASAITVTVLREAMALQRFEEARARFGSRYTEYLRYLGVRSSDARLQRPEFLGGGRYPIQFSEVLQTAEGTNPVGEMYGHGLGVARSRRYRRFFEEHGYIYSLMTVKPKAIYTNCMERHWWRRTKEDFYQKELESIGQQEVHYRELNIAHATPANVFGYQNRYEEYRVAQSGVSGEFRTSLLNFWHFGRALPVDVALNASFVACNPTELPFAVPANDSIYVMARHSIQARRLLSKFGSSYIR